VDDGIENPDNKRVFDASFFKTVDGNYLDEMLTWVEDFRKRMDDEESKQSKEELDSEQRNLFMPDGLQNRTKRKRTTKNLENYSKI
jgi:hypothetical protein